MLGTTATMTRTGHVPLTVLSEGVPVPLEVTPEPDGALRIEGRGDRPLTVVVPLEQDEAVVGFGEQYVSIAQRGRIIDGWTESALHGPPRSSYFVAPIFHSSAGYTLLLLTDSRWAADVGNTDPGRLAISVPLTEVTALLYVGPPADALAGLVRRFGAPAVPPDWAFGVWVAARSGTDAVLAEARRFQREGIPFSAVWVDDYYDAATNSGAGISYPYPAGPYPSLRALTDGLHELGARALGYLNCAVYRGTPMYERALAEGLVVRDGAGEPHHFRFFHPQRQSGNRDSSWGIVMEDDVAALLDFGKEGARRLWVERLQRKVQRDGWDGWMQDFGEQHPDQPAHNRYPIDYHRATAAALAELDADAVFFVRSACMGSSVYAPIMWGGDQGCDWSSERGLAGLIPAGISAGLAGVPVWCPDIAGIVELDTDTEAGGQDEELWIRWMQFGALTPIMRLHPGFKNRDGLGVNVWTSARTTELFKRYARLHERLRPYLVRHARAAAESGMPLIRALLIDFPADRQCWDIGDQYLLGDALLVAPVVERGRRRRDVYLPAGDWHDVWTGRAVRGPAWIVADAPLEQIPLFRRGGYEVPL